MTTLTAPSSSASDLDENSLEKVKESLRLIEDLKFFLATAPANWQENQVIRRYYLNHDEGFVSCVFWNNLYFVTGTDIVRCIVYKFEHFGRKITDRKKFEEGIFSDLRNLKCGTDAILELPRSEFLEFLFKNSCLRTQKKQKVFFWFNVPHDKLMADALERDLKKEKLGQVATTTAHKDPAISFKYDESSSLYNQLAEHMEKQKKINQIPSADDPIELPQINKGIQGAPPGAPIQSAPPGAPIPGAHPSAPRRAPIAGAPMPGAPQSATFSSNPVIKEENYEFLPLEAAAQSKTQADYEDDFPLDYFNANDPNLAHQQAYAQQQRQQLPTGQNQYNEEYITLDNYHPYNNAVEENYDSIVDPSAFMGNFNGTASASQVVYNDEYLIEQTQPLKTPLPMGPKSGKDDFFPRPMSAKYQTNFQRQLHPATATITVTTPLTSTHFPPPLAPGTIPQFNYDPNGPFYPVDAQVAYNFKQRSGEPEYWAQQPNSALYGASMEQTIQIPMNQHMYDQDYGFAVQQQNNSYPMNPQMANLQHNQPHMHNFAHSQYQQQVGQHSPRQHQHNASIMMKKRHMYKGNGITKPPNDKQTSYAGALDDVVNSSATNVVPKEEVKAELPPIAPPSN